MSEKAKRKRRSLFVQVRFLILIMLWLHFVQWLFLYEPIHIDIPFGRSIEFVMNSALSFLWLPFAIRHIDKFGTGRKLLCSFILIVMSLTTIITVITSTFEPMGPCFPMYEQVGNTRFYVRTGSYFCWYDTF